MKFDEKDVEKRKVALDSNPSIFNWNTITLATHGGNKHVWKRNLFVIFGPSIISVTCLLAAEINVLSVFFALFIHLIGSLFYHYLGLPYSNIKYKLKQNGIEEIRYEIIPENTFSILRGFAWFGVAVCIFSVLFMGPLALVGAGGLALMSFKFTRIEQQESYDSYLFDDDMMVFNVLDNNCIRMHSNPVEDACQSTLYFNDEDRELVLSNLKQVLPNAHYIDLKTESDLYENELFKSALAEGRRLYEEQQSKEHA